MSEEGIIFGSTANGCPSVYMPIANRYYERVRGWTPQLTLAIHRRQQSLPPDHRQSSAGRSPRRLHGRRRPRSVHGPRYPQQYWNRTAFVCEPTGHLVSTFVLSADGADFHSTSPANLLASDDEWVAPIMAEVGPDGCVWVIDWYNYIVQHNPTPEGFETGKGARLRNRSARQEARANLSHRVWLAIPCPEVESDGSVAGGIGGRPRERQSLLATPCSTPARRARQARCCAAACSTC